MGDEYQARTQARRIEYTREERDWRLDTCLQGGLVTRHNGRTIRLFGQWYDGHPTVGQFTT